MALAKMMELSVAIVAAAVMVAMRVVVAMVVVATAVVERVVASREVAVKAAAQAGGLSRPCSTKNREGTLLSTWRGLVEARTSRWI